MKQLIYTIIDINKSNNEYSFIGNTSSRDKTMNMIKEYYGVGVSEDVTLHGFRDIQDSDLDFEIHVSDKGKLGGEYKVIVCCATLDSL